MRTAFLSESKESQRNGAMQTSCALEEIAVSAAELVCIDGLLVRYDGLYRRFVLMARESLFHFCQSD